MIERIPVHVCSQDPISSAGVTAGLRPRPEVRLIEAPELTPACVTIVVADRMEETTACLIREVQGRGCRRIVLVAAVVSDADLFTAVELGVCGLVRRAEATPERLADTVVRAASGEGSLPPDLLGRLLGQVSRLQHQVLAPRGLSVSGLSDREAGILRLVADGLDTREIASELIYSERTVKNVLHDITSRFHLRNRAHAVAYAMREGLI